MSGLCPSKHSEGGEFSLKSIDRAKAIVFIIVRLSIVIAATISIVNRNWAYLGMSVLTLLVMLLPSMAEKKFKLDFPSEFEIVVILFIYAALFLGESNLFYDRFWWWDTMLHSSSGLILGNIGYALVSYLNGSSTVKINLSPLFVALFSFCFALSIGALWEIYEFSMDSFFGFNMQRTGLDDTMKDLILDTLGALLFSVLGYYHQIGKINLISKYIIRYDNRNAPINLENKKNKTA